MVKEANRISLIYLAYNSISLCCIMHHEKALHNLHRSFYRSVKGARELRATSHTRLRTRDHYTSNTLIGGNVGASPSLLHTMLEGPTEYVNARWMSTLHGFPHGIEWIMFHGHSDYFQKPLLGGRPNTKPRDHDTPNAHNR